MLSRILRRLSRPASRCKRNLISRRVLILERLEERRLLSTTAAIGPASIITTVAGNRTAGYSGDNGQADVAEMNFPRGVAVDSAGDLFLADFNNSCIREVNVATGVITTVAGNGTSGFAGDNGLATAAELSGPSGVAVDSAGDLFIADTNNNRIREVNASTGVITTIAGNGTAGYSGDYSVATAAELDLPGGIALDASGNLYFADTDNNRVREVDHTTGVITTIAGNGTAGYSGDYGVATAAELNEPIGVAVDAAGQVFIADFNNQRVREVNLSSSEITTVAGNGTSGYGGDTGQAANAELSYPWAVAVDGNGNLFIADYHNNVIREVNLASGVITTAAGNGTGGYSGDAGPATVAELSDPAGIAVDSAGNLFIADAGNSVIRRVHAGASIQGTATPGLFDSSSAVFYLRDSNTAGYADSYFPYGSPGANWIPLAGDWSGDGQTTIGLYDPSTSIFYLQTSNAAGPAAIAFQYGPGGKNWIPLVGNWTGNPDGQTTVGLYDPSTSIFYLRTSNSAGYADISFQYGPAGQNWVPLAGDWVGDGQTTIGLYNPTTATFYLRDFNTAGYANTALRFGTPASNWIPVVGDWGSSGQTTVGLYVPSIAVFYLRNTNTTGYADLAFAYGPAGGDWTPIVGDWTGPGTSAVAASARQSDTNLIENDVQPAATSDVAGVNPVDGTQDAANSGSSAATPQVQAVNPQAVDRIDLSSVAQSALPSTAATDNLGSSLDTLANETVSTSVLR